MQLLRRVFYVVLLLLSKAPTTTVALRVGVGRGDGTGPIRSYVFMGMAKPSQKGTGLHLRLFSRAFVFVDETDGSRAAFVCVDGGMVGHVLKKRALAQANLTDFYDATNTIVSGTHTHSGPSGFLQHELFQLAGSGWVPEVLDAMATGIATALRRAHADVQAQLLEEEEETADERERDYRDSRGGERTKEASLRNNNKKYSVAVAASKLRNASINRSPSAYANNPEAERASYASETDDDFFALGVVERTSADDDDTAVVKVKAAATWFAVHGTSMNNTNTLVSGDNKGLASRLAERRYAGAVVAFASSNLGDVSPNTLGPRCRDTGEPCDFATSTCPETVHGKTNESRNEQCSSVGPGADMFESNEIIADAQLNLAVSMLDDLVEHREEKNSKETPSFFDWLDLSSATVASRHTFVEMPGLRVRDWRTNESKGTLCPPAMGQAFAAGTVDGPGAFDFAQSQTAPNLLWRVAADVLAGGIKVSKELAECHRPKPILLPTGLMNTPHPWAPTILPIQLVKVGSLVLAAPPTELTSMAGRRLKRALETVFRDENNETVLVVVAGLSNEYADYTTTFEEYQVQRYEGGSTIYGPHQLDAFLQEFATLARALIANIQSPAGPEPEDFSDLLEPRRAPFTSDRRPERPGFGRAFGDLLDQSPPRRDDGAMPCLGPGDVVTADFLGADPNRDPKLEGTYLEVVQQVVINDTSSSSSSSTTWVTRFVDADPETRLSCAREHTYYRVTIRFDVPDDVGFPGVYRILYHGDAPNPEFSSDTTESSTNTNNTLEPFTGVSDTFVVSASCPGMYYRPETEENRPDSRTSTYT